MLRFDWDAANEGHIGRRGISPRQAEAVLTIAPVEYGVSFTNGELRMAYVGPDTERRMLFVVATPRRGALRMVTAYPARKEMKAFYRRHKQEAGDEG